MPCCDICHVLYCAAKYGIPYAPLQINPMLFKPPSPGPEVDARFESELLKGFQDDSFGIHV